MSIFTGSAVSIITPFRRGEVDLSAFTRLIELQIASGSSALVLFDTAGEGTSLTTDERLSIIQFAVERVNGRVPVIIGCGGPYTEAVIDECKTAEAIGADALLIVPPYFTKASDRGLYEHFTAIADSVEIPILLHNSPLRTGINLKPELIGRLRQHANIVGIKESSGDIEQIAMLLALCPDLDVYAGNDSHALPVLSIGGKGMISTIANIMPDAMHDMYEAFTKRDMKRARGVQTQLIPLWRAAFCDVNPVPIKAMMGMLKLCDPDVRMPLLPLEAANLRLVSETLHAYQLI